MDEKPRIFDTFWKSGLHGADWPHDTYSGLVYDVHNVESQHQERREDWIKNDGQNKLHSEQMVCQTLDNRLKDRALPPQTIQWFINHSPCGDCADRITAWMTSAKQRFNIDIKINMVFSTLYMIQRPSCEENPSCFHVQSSPIPGPVHQRNVAGLTNLWHADGVTIGTFGQQEWQDLADRLGLQEERVSTYSNPDSDRRLEDERMREDLSKLVFE